MIIINTYTEYCEALEAKQSEDPAVRSDAKKALAILKQKAPTLYLEYDDRYNGKGENKPKKAKTYSRPSTLAERQNYLKEHSNIDVTEIRAKLRTSLLKGHYGLGLLFSVPLWMRRDDVIATFDQLDPAELITSNGRPVSRDTVLRRCIRKTIELGLYDEEKLRQEVVSMFCSYYNNNTITLREPVLVGPVKRMLNNEATVEELMKVYRPDCSFSIGNLVELINSKELQVTTEDKNMWEKRQRKKAKKEAKRQKKEKDSPDGMSRHR